jgi:gamma-tubulin complex component 5
MDSKRGWTDFHFLNSVFSDVVEGSKGGGANQWIQPALVRLSFHGSRDKERAISGTVKAIDGLLVEYAAPFPLTYIFTPTTMQVYGEVFTFLLQIRRAKSVLERILIRGDARVIGMERKMFYALRSRLNWFVK